MGTDMKIIKDYPCRHIVGGKDQTVPLAFDWDEGDHEDADDIRVIEQNLPLDKVNYCYLFQMISCNHPTSIPFRYYGVWGHTDLKERLHICESAESEIVTEGMTTKYGMCRFEKSNFNYVLTKLVDRFGDCIVLSRKAIPLDLFFRFVNVDYNRDWDECVYLDYDRLTEFILSINAIYLQCNVGAGGKILKAVYEEAKWL